MSSRTLDPTTALIITGGILAGALLTQAPVSAHSGQGAYGVGTGLLHPISGADHLLAMVAVGIVAAIAGTRRIAILTPAAFLLGLVVGGVLSMASPAISGVEVAVSLSVFALGVLCLAGLRRATLLLPVTAAAFGLAHGQAHGAEIPLGASPITYVIGFLATSALLHLAGGIGGIALRNSHRSRILAGALITGAGAAALLGV